MNNGGLTADVVLDRLRALGSDGGDFRMVRGGKVRMRAIGNEVVVDRPGVQPLTRGELQVAIEHLPVRGPSELPANRVHGTSYLYALLTDDRIVGEELARREVVYAEALEDARRRQAELDAARGALAEVEATRDEAVRRAHRFGAGVRLLARELGLGPEAVMRLVERPQGPIWRVRAECGVPQSASAIELAQTLGGVGRVISISIFQPTKDGFGPGPVVVDVSAPTAANAVARVQELLRTQFGLAPDYSIAAAPRG